MDSPASLFSNQNPPASAFAKRLAHTDKKVRDKALKALIRFLSTTKELSHLEWLKLWKGLFYCFWMSDKPLIQQQLAEDLAALAGRLERKCRWEYVNAFWDTMTREWTGIDRLRLDKFYMLFRKFLYHSFAMLASANWNKGDVDTFTEILTAFPLSPTNISVPDSIRYHVTDIYLEELEKAVPINSFSSIPMTRILAPFFNLISQTSSATVFKRVKESVFHTIFQRAEENKDMYDIPEIALYLQSAAVDPLTTEVNRNRILMLHEIFTSNCPEAVPMEVEVESSEESKDASSDPVKEMDTSEESKTIEKADNEEMETSEDSKTMEKADNAKVQADDSNENWEDIAADAAPCFDDWEPVSAKEAMEIEPSSEGNLETVSGECKLETISSECKSETASSECKLETETVFQVPTIPATRSGKRKKTKASRTKKSPVTETAPVSEATVTTPMPQQQPQEAVLPSSESKRVVWQLANNTVKRFRTKSPSLSVSSSTPAESALPNPIVPKSVLKIRTPAATNDVDEPVVHSEPTTTEEIPVLRYRNKRRRTSTVLHLDSAANLTLTPDMSPADVRRLTEYNTMKNEPPRPPRRPAVRGRGTGKKNRDGKRPFFY